LGINDWNGAVPNKCQKLPKSSIKFGSRKNASSYNLSLSYQLNENALAMRLILPLDLSYALLYPIFVCLTIVVRGHKSSLSLSDYNFLLHLLNTVGKRENKNKFKLISSFSSTPPSQFSSTSASSSS
jgi:hypothetical protein